MYGWLMGRGPIRVLELTGTPRQLGRAHGEAWRDSIRAYCEDRLALVAAGAWSSHPLERSEVLALAERCIPAHEAYAPELVAELAGIGEATGSGLAELVVLCGFTDFVDTVHGVYGASSPTGAAPPGEDDCTAVIVPDGRADGAGFLAQTWDMHDSAADHVVLLDLRPDDAPRSLVFTTTGCIGQIGMNDRGICVGINNLPGGDGRIGVTWPFVVRKALAQTDLDAALACVTGAPLAGAHNYLLFDASGRGYDVEASSTRVSVTSLGAEVLAHTNHCLAPETLAVSQPKAPELQASSEDRLRVASDELARGAVTADRLVELLRHPAVCYRGAPPFHLETCGAAIMRPATGDLWACWGLPSENDFQRFSLTPARR
jgi:isopenicillin-N N-acyltransferase like protein